MKNKNSSKPRLTFIAVIIIGLIGMQSCTNSHELRIDLQSWFYNDSVKVEVNGQVVYNNLVSTDSLLGVADIKSLNYPEGSYPIKVTINNTFTKTETVNLDHYKCMAVKYNASTNELEFIYYPTPLMYY